jgi:large subunit ribosomal protein L29
MAKRMEKIREAGVNELEAQQKELAETIFRLRFQLSTGQAEALKRLRESKKDFARVKTALRAHELSGGKTPEAKKSAAPAATPAKKVAAPKKKSTASPRQKSKKA